MEDPRVDAPEVVRQLVTRPTLKGLRQTIEKYFSPDVKFFHYLINSEGREDLIAIYQFAEVSVSYQRVVFDHVAYDPERDIVTLQMMVFVRPALRLWTEAVLQFCTLLELEDFDPDAEEEVGKESSQLRKAAEGILAPVRRKTTHKRIKVQRDYFIRQPILSILPFIGDIYNNNYLRLIIGTVQATLFIILRTLVVLFVPSFITNTVLSILKESPL